MAAYTPQFAPVVVLAFLGTIFLLIASALVLLVGLLRKSRTLQRLGLLSGVILVVLYGGILMGISLLSQEVSLPARAWKYFCEIDCHLAYSVVDVRVASSIGPEMQQVVSGGKFVVVQLKTWFDPGTISAHRGNAPLTPNRRRVGLQDGARQWYEPSARGEAVLSAMGLISTALSTPLRPGESYVTFLVFEVPAATEDLRLLVGSGDGENLLLWTDENSLFHKKIYFQLKPA